MEAKSKVARSQATDKIAVLVTCATAREAREIARALVESRLAACVNVLGARVGSVYRWKEKVEEANELLLIIKSSRAKFRALEAEVKRLHSYDVPEIIALPIVAGSAEYLAWIADNIEDRTPSSAKR